MKNRSRYLNSFFAYILFAIFIACFEWWTANGPEGLCTSRYPFPRGDCIHSILPDDPRFWGAFIKRIILMCGVPVAIALFAIVMFFVETRKERKARRQSEPSDNS
jgi:hypothetical protein